MVSFISGNKKMSDASNIQHSNPKSFMSMVGEAIEEFTTTIKILENTNNSGLVAQYLVIRGKAYELLENYTLALEDLNNAAGRNKTYYESNESFLSSRSNCYRKNEEYINCMDDISRLIELTDKRRYSNQSIEITETVNQQLRQHFTV